MFRLGWLIFPVSAFFALAMLNPGDVNADNIASQRVGYAGDSTCLPCHRSQNLSYAHTGHRLSSQLANTTSIRGAVQNGSNILTITPENDPALPALRFVMSEKGGSYFETAVTGFGSDLQRRTEQIDIVTGSGKRGQTYLYWQQDRLFELPVSYWSDGNKWINSPGYEDGTANFSRAIAPGCIECHATYMQPISSEFSTNRFDRKSLVPGISCETCHGPGANHVLLESRRTISAHGAHQEAILNPSSFPRDRQVDLCGYCHNGQLDPVAPAFSYVPGRPLTDFFKPVSPPVSNNPDVHGNQVGLLKLSRCFQSSPSMTCSTCHDVHSVERPAISYSDRCLTCHQWQTCKVAKKLGHGSTSNCIDCHMPVLPTDKIVSETAGTKLHASMRSHWIKIYSQLN
ncbi:multiheme c-type cytochrome [Granulicella sp. S190]|uniref:multiheme c-type cytochrome n=1 Tax=Granulicella sp. S190 TaxID=1747226 RepID=UPI00131D6BD2|nr:multiheme c-type cytochrome [Granulicella sp. S190]